MSTHQTISQNMIFCIYLWISGHGSVVDWWTFGIFLYELIHGKTPFKGNGNQETLFNVVGRLLKFPDGSTFIFAAKDLIREFMRVAGMQWPFSSKLSSLHQFVPYKVFQEKRFGRSYVISLSLANSFAIEVGLDGWVGVVAICKVFGCSLRLWGASGRVLPPPQGVGVCVLPAALGLRLWGATFFAIGPCLLLHLQRSLGGGAVVSLLGATTSLFFALLFGLCCKGVGCYVLLRGALFSLPVQTHHQYDQPISSTTDLIFAPMRLMCSPSDAIEYSYQLTCFLEAWPLPTKPTSFTMASLKKDEFNVVMKQGVSPRAGNVVTKYYTRPSFVFNL
ncbi:hypothetical protein IFM89_007888 [Coptis chinensis]|uniref:non-specific serine/threonine protein kinase n=1 Tax=Coptis chinensis TaxID=261450 RepID=A0A835HAA8_9MAGN|nr:hypothetical protein IFM89_007888 [Coptis chinensis]